MGYRVSLLVLLPLVVSAQTTGPAPNDQVKRDQIRERAQEDILRRPADVNIEPDMAAMRKAMEQPEPDFDHVEPVREPLPPIQVDIGEAASLETALQLVTHSIGWGHKVHPQAKTNWKVELPNEFMTLNEIMTALESTAPVKLKAFPGSRLIMVMPSQYPKHKWVPQ